MRLVKLDSETAENAIMCLSILKSISTVFDDENADNEIAFIPDWDSVHELYFYAIDCFAKKNRIRFFENDCVEVDGIENDDITEYYKLAYKLGELKNLPKNDNPCFIEADKAMSNTLGRVNSYVFGCRLKVGDRRKPRLMLLFCHDGYYPNAEVIYELYQFWGFFREKIPLMQAELREIESKCKAKKTRQTKVKKSKGRKKAA